jgi:hypothetical protein
MSHFRTRAYRLFRMLRAAWLLVGIFGLTLIALEAVLRLAFAAKDLAFPLPDPDPRVTARGYDDGGSWVPALYAAQQSVQVDWHPFELFRARAGTDGLLAIGADGRRRTFVPTPEPSRARRPIIWVFGGSSAWGWGARWDRTIPSILANHLSRRWPDVLVRNFAQIGYVSA